ncbi:hypothetical protein HMPREF1255_0802 [Propionimicrobium sp. BV2F7]|nr:hypothetical protein HMPREF1255_0802 [Propionimicrobium sp. BV2F7]
MVNNEGNLMMRFLLMECPAAVDKIFDDLSVSVDSRYKIR